MLTASEHFNKKNEKSVIQFRRKYEWLQKWSSNENSTRAIYRFLYPLLWRQLKFSYLDTNKHSKKSKVYEKYISILYRLWFWWKISNLVACTRGVACQMELFDFFIGLLLVNLLCTRVELCSKRIFQRSVSFCYYDEEK